MRLIFALLSALIGLIILMHPFHTSQVHARNQDGNLLDNADPLAAMRNLKQADQELHEHLKTLGAEPQPENDDVLPPNSLKATPGAGEATDDSPAGKASLFSLLPPPPKEKDRFFVHHHEISVDGGAADTISSSQSDDVDDDPRPRHQYEITVDKQKQ